MIIVVEIQFRTRIVKRQADRLNHCATRPVKPNEVKIVFIHRTFLRHKMHPMTVCIPYLMMTGWVVKAWKLYEQTYFLSFTCIIIISITLFLQEAERCITSINYALYTRRVVVYTYNQVKRLCSARIHDSRAKCLLR